MTQDSGETSASADEIKHAAQAVSVLETMRALVASATEAQARTADIATAALAARAQIDGEQAVIATKSSHIQKAQEHADGVRANLDRVLTAATQSGTEADGHRNRAQAAADTSTELSAAIAARKTTVETDAAAVAEAKGASEEIVLALQALQERADSAEGRVAVYENKLGELEEAYRAQLKRITELLPAATVTGLAHAFDDRRQSFLEPSKRWQSFFVGSVVLLVLLAGTGLVQAYFLDAASGYDGLWRLWIARLPVAAALVWLAIHAAREAALAKRLEEDYGYKAAISASFLGFNEQMKKIADSAKPDTPLAKLCSDTLQTLASPPGRIYDKHELTTTPVDKIKELVELVLARKEAQATKGTP